MTFYLPDEEVELLLHFAGFPNVGWWVCARWRAISENANRIPSLGLSGCIRLPPSSIGEILKESVFEQPNRSKANRRRVFSALLPLTRLVVEEKRRRGIATFYRNVPCDGQSFWQPSHRWVDDDRKTWGVSWDFLTEMRKMVDPYCPCTGWFYFCTQQTVSRSVQHECLRVVPTEALWVLIQACLVLHLPDTLEASVWVLNAKIQNSSIGATTLSTLMTQSGGGFHGSACRTRNLKRFSNAVEECLYHYRKLPLALPIGKDESFLLHPLGLHQIFKEKR